MSSDDIIEAALGADVIEYRRRDGGPMRDIVRQHPHQEVRMIPSWKCGWRIYTTMDLERQYARVFEVDGRVVWYRSQPLTLEFIIDDKIVRYTPDFEVRLGKASVVIETKPAVMLEKNPQLKRKLNKVECIYAARGKIWKRLGSNQLPPRHWMEAAESIEVRGRTYIDPIDEHRVLSFLRDNGPATLRACSTKVRRHEDPENAVISMIIRSRRIQADMAGPIWSGTTISLR
jgi:hypothetical protein